MGSSAETILIFVGVFGQVRSEAFNHKYKIGDLVPFYANKIGPFHNPSETYAYYEFPFCRPAHWQEKKESLGEVLNGDRLAPAPYKLYFRVNSESQVASLHLMRNQLVIKKRQGGRSSMGVCSGTQNTSVSLLQPLVLEQLFTGVVSIIILGMIGTFQIYDLGVLKIALIITYAITNVIAGFASISLYHQLEGSNQLSTDAFEEESIPSRLCLLWSNVSLHLVSLALLL